MAHIVFLKSQMGKKGGLEKYTRQLMLSLCQKGHTVTLLTTGVEPSFFQNVAFKVVNLGRRLPLSFLHLLVFDRKCAIWLKKNRHDIVFGMDRNFCLQDYYRAGNGVHAGYLEKRKENASFFKRLSFSINPLHRLILKMEKKTFESKHLKRLFTNSEMVKQEVLSFYNVDPEKITVVHNGVEFKEMEVCFEQGFQMKEKLKKELLLDPEAYQFLFIGHEYGRKGLFQLLDALKRVKNDHWQLSVVGKERVIDRFKARAKELGLDEQVFFFGERKEVKTFYSIADAVVIPSLYDPFANVTIEALAMGVSVVSSTTNGGSEIVTDERGIVCQDVQDSALFAQVLDSVMLRPKTKERADAIRQSVAAYDFSNQIEKITCFV